MSEKLVKELNKEKKARQKEIDGNKIVEQATLLLNEAASADEELLEKIGLDKQIKYAKKLKEDANRTKIAEQIYNQDTFTGKQIRALCNKYDLRILRADMYSGSVVVDVPRKIREFCDRNDIIPHYNSFFILAPTETFKTVKHVPVNADPILFYRDGSEHSSSSKDTIEKNDILLQIHNWGNDFTFLRRFRWLFNNYTWDSEEMSNFGRTVISLGIFVMCILVTIFTSQITLFYMSLTLGGVFTTALTAFSHYYKKKRLDGLWNTNTI